MFHTGTAVLAAVPARLQNIVKTDNISLNVRVRIRDGVTNPRLRCQIHNNLWAIRVKNFFDRRLVRNAFLHKYKIRKCRKLRKTALFQTHIVIIIHIVYSDNSRRRHFLQKPLRKIAPDKAGGSGNQYCLLFQLHFFPFLSRIPFVV
jgi:hypothetical protein